MSDSLNFLKNAVQNLRITSIIEILIVAYLIYRLYNMIRETRAEQLVKGLVMMLLLIPLSYLLNFTMLYSILSKTITVGVLSVFIIFQPEIRRALEQLGRSAFKESMAGTSTETARALEEIVTAAVNLSATKTGALIAIEQNTMLGDISGTGTQIDARVSAPLIENIFYPNTPLHDGAMIVRNNRIYAAGCVLPLTNSMEISKKLGTRHRAGIGLTEVSDAAVVIVSEETGVISLALNGKLVRNYDGDRLLAILLKIISRKNEEEKKTVKERFTSWIRPKNRTSW